MSKENGKTGLEALQQFVWINAMLIAAIAINGYLFTEYWSWFIAPIFGLRPLLFWESAALIYIFKSFILPQKSWVEMSGVTVSDSTKNFFFMLLADAVTYGFLSIIKYCM